ncbi:DMT family transporter [Nitrospinota bacterium]
MDFSDQTTGILFATIAALAWTVFSFAMKMALRDASVLKAAAAVNGLNAALVTAVSLLLIPPAAFVPENTGTVLNIVLAGGLHIGLARLFFYTAIQRLGPNRAMPIAMSYPIVTALSAAFMLGEAITGRILAGLLLLLAGITLIVRAEPAQPDTVHSASPSWKAFGWASAGITSLLWGVAAIYFKKAALGVHPLAASAYALWFGFVVALLIASWMDPRGALSSISWRWLVFSACCQTVAVPFYIFAFTHTLAVRVTAIVSAQPLLAIPIGWLLMREAENISPRLIAGAALVVFGTLLVIL